MKVAKQTTLRDRTALFGVGIHSGLPVTLAIHPADAGTGLRFIRTRIDGQQDREIPADMSAVTATEFATVLGDESGPLVSTAEHVLAVLLGQPAADFGAPANPLTGAERLPMIPAGLPSALLERRPDIAAAQPYAPPSVRVVGVSSLDEAVRWLCVNGGVSSACRV